MLSRNKARMCIVVDILAVFCLIIPRVLYAGSPEIYLFWAYTAVGLTVIILIISLIYQRCPNCGKGTAPLQWWKNGTKHCKKCGKPFVYDK
ncbi:hypothetical protein [Anaerotignum propionicum]|uniref:CXXC-20-CXXC protein n=1 Tax=Anaerotignum propionicum DSM 1682 TaxID=991789 RepID=A0A0X8VDH1_ANAPI|nr:hypothetical protein [Anaerotignum propionicum]AMJ41994.1 hypothetical protein CPRO_24280 [Anaerotignum propionicum DSM 1682]SHF03344.1 hypothetical protein SAMN02745151_02564 [[Clostridium] propionicum DSM 1682] [Anaerotignum propionicum DSM 1682]